MALFVFGLAMAQRGQGEAKAFAAAHGWRYDKTGVETFRIVGRDQGGDWTLIYGRSETAGASKNLAFEFAVPARGEAMLMARSIRGLLNHGLTGAVARGLDALPGRKAGIALDGQEAPIDWVRRPGFVQQYALLGDPSGLGPAIDEDVAGRLMAYPAMFSPTVSAKHGRCRVLLSVRTTPQALEAMPKFVALGRAMVASTALAKVV